MFSQTWSKYMPVIRILIKKSAGSDQVLNMNSTDFIRATGGRKIKFSFDMQLMNGQLVESARQTPVAKEFALLLQEDEQARKLIKHQKLGFAMNNSFQLSIKNHTPAPPPGIVASEESDASSKDDATAS
jgi:hypothetical protein